MKNGLVLLLLMVALVAMTASAGAMAPVIGQLPAVIVGGADTVDQSTQDVHLLRYVNVFNLADPGVITRKTNPDNFLKLAVWYNVTGTSAATLKASNPVALVDQMTAGEITALTTVGTRPAAAKNINNTGTSSTWVSLIEDAGVSPVSAALATVATNGVPAASLTGVVGTKHVNLYAVDVDEVTTAVGQGGFDVFSLLASTDGLSPRTNAGSGTTPGSWIKVQGLGTTSTASSIGFIGRAAYTTTTPGYQYSTWAKIITPAINPVGMIYEAKATLTGSAVNGVNTPGFRLWFIANLGVHSGGVHVVTKSGLQGIIQSVPVAASSKEIRAYWSAPRDLVDMEDGGFLATLQKPGTDQREYGVQFDMVQEDLASEDAGNVLRMTAFNIDLIPRPISVVPAIQWADGIRPMNKSTNPDTGLPNDDGFAAATPGNITGYNAGFASVGYSNITLGMGTTNAAYAKFQPAGGTFATLPAWTSGKLIRTTYNVQAINPQGTALAATNIPGFRLQMFAFVNATVNPNLGVLRTDNVFNYDAVRATKPVSAGVLPHTIMSGCPKALGSDIECYAYTHTAANIAGSVVFPQVDMIQSDRSLTGNTGVVKATYSNNWNGWGKPSNLVFNSIKMEVLNP